MTHNIGLFVGRLMTVTPFWGKKFQTRTKGAIKELCLLIIHIANIGLIHINFLLCHRYSTRCLLHEFPDSKKFKISGATVNPYQKPILLFMKHIMCWSNFGDLIIDATSGTGTLAVKLFCLIACLFANET
jgi:DNA modification methylase